MIGSLALSGMRTHCNANGCAYSGCCSVGLSSWQSGGAGRNLARFLGLMALLTAFLNRMTSVVGVPRDRKSNRSLAHGVWFQLGCSNLMRFVSSNVGKRPQGGWRGCLEGRRAAVLVEKSEIRRGSRRFGVSRSFSPGSMVDRTNVVEE